MEHSKSRSLRGLDLINLSLADVRDGIGPFLGIFLLSSQHWNLRDIGIATSLATFAGVIVQTPVGAFVDRYEHKKRVVGIASLVCFAALPVRGVLYTLSPDPYFITSVQVLDGLSAGIFGVVSILVIADLTKGSGHFNLANGMMITAVGLGASLSNAAGGYIANLYSFKYAFLFLSATAAVAFVICLLFMKETYHPEPA